MAESGLRVDERSPLPGKSSAADCSQFVSVVKLIRVPSADLDNGQLLMDNIYSQTRCAGLSMAMFFFSISGSRLIGTHCIVPYLLSLSN